jgi:hypothetical protein
MIALEGFAVLISIENIFKREHILLGENTFHREHILPQNIDALEGFRVLSYIQRTHSIDREQIL